MNRLRRHRCRWRPPAGPPPEAYVEHLAVGWSLKSMPLFLSADRYVEIPLEATYMAAFGGLPVLYRNLLERRKKVLKHLEQ